MRRAGAAAAALGMLLLAGCAPTPVGHAELELVGIWSGQGDADGDGVLEMIVQSAAADGSEFDGEITFSIGGEHRTAEVHASMTPHGHLAGSVGTDASIEVHISGPAALDYCFARYGSSPVLACSRILRQP